MRPARLAGSPLHGSLRLLGVVVPHAPQCQHQTSARCSANWCPWPIARHASSGSGGGGSGAASCASAVSSCGGWKQAAPLLTSGQACAKAAPLELLASAVAPEAVGEEAGVGEAKASSSPAVQKPKRSSKASSKASPARSVLMSFCVCRIPTQHSVSEASTSANAVERWFAVLSTRIMFFWNPDSRANLWCSWCRHGFRSVP